MRTPLIALALMSCASRLPGQATFTGLGTISLPQGLGIPVIEAMTNDGQVLAGRIFFETPPGPLFQWTSKGGFELLGGPGGPNNSSVMSISDDASTMAVYSWSVPVFLPNHTYAWTRQAGYVELLKLPGDQGAIPTGMSADGTVIVGGSYIPGRGYRAVRWAGSTTPEDLGQFPGNFQTNPRTLSADGTTMVGFIQGVGSVQPFTWREAKGLVAMPLDPGVVWAGAYGVNRDGTCIVGNAYVDAVACAVRWKDSGPCEVLGVLPGMESSAAFYTSADGSTIFGRCSNPGYRPFIWRSELGMRDLNEYLPGFGVNLDGWLLNDVRAISADGRTIAGIGEHNGQTECWVVTLACYPDCNSDGALNLSDFGCFQTKFALVDPYADCNGDGVRNLSDFGCFQTKFALGCP